MSEADLDARLRRLFAGIDTRPDFAARVHERIRVTESPAEGILRLARERDQAWRALKREAWCRVANVAGIGIAAGTVLWRHAPAIARWVGSSLTDGDPWFAATVTTGVLALVVGSVLRSRAAPR